MVTGYLEVVDTSFNTDIKLVQEKMGILMSGLPQNFATPTRGDFMNQVSNTTINLNTNTIGRPVVGGLE